MSDAPLFEVTTPAGAGSARRLTTAAKVQAALKVGDVDTVLIESIIDTVSGDCVRYARLAMSANGATRTFGQEVVRATWLGTGGRRGSKLILPWRTPITAVGTVVEAGVNLAVNVDFRLVAGGLLERMSGDSPACWSAGKIVVPYTAGWSLPDGVPPEFEGQVIEQVKMKYLASDQNPALRSEAVPDVYSASYAVAGGDSIGESGLLKSLEAALASFKSWSA